MNDRVERCFGAMTGQLQYFGQIGLINKGVVGQVSIYGDLSSGV